MTMSWKFFSTEFSDEEIFSPLLLLFFHQNKNVWINWHMEGLHLYSNQSRTNSRVCMHKCVFCVHESYMWAHGTCICTAVCVPCVTCCELCYTCCVGLFCVCVSPTQVCCVCTWCVCTWCACWCEYVDTIMPSQNSKPPNS